MKSIALYLHTSIAILLQKYALLLTESGKYTTNLYHDTPPTYAAMLLQNYQGRVSLEHPPPPNVNTHARPEKDLPEKLLSVTLGGAAEVIVPSKGKENHRKNIFLPLRNPSRSWETKVKFSKRENWKIEKGGGGVSTTIL